MCAALERVQGPGKIIGIGNRGFVTCCRQEVLQCLQVGLGFAFKNIQQYRVDRIFVCAPGLFLSRCVFAFSHGFRAIGLRHRHHAGIGNFAVGQGVGTGFEVGRVDRRRTAFFKIFDQGRQVGGDIFQQAGNVIVHENAAVDHAVQHVFNGPSQFADNQCADHAATAFQRVEGTANFRQGAAVIVLTQKHRQVFADGFQHLAGFFNKNFEYFIVDQVVFIERRFRCGLGGVVFLDGRLC